MAGTPSRVNGPLPATVVAGFLGAGKTTLINGLLANAGGRKIGVAVNDFGDVNIDAELIVDVADGVMSLTNGCICCSMRSGVLDTMFHLAERAEPLDHAIVEASGASDPGPIVEAFRELQRLGVVRFDGLISMVDADQLRFDDPAVGPLARRQIVGADLVVLNKVDLAGDATDQAEMRVRALAPEARIVRAEEAAVPLEVLLGLTPRADSGPPQAAPPHFAFETLTWSRSEPAAFKPLFDALLSLPPSVLRAKGFLHLAERPKKKVVAHLVGRRLYAQPVGDWADARPKSRVVLIGTFSRDEEAEIRRHLDSAAALPSPD